MTEIATDDDQSGFVAEEPDHCLDCFRLIHPGETYYPGEDDTVLYPNCVSDLHISGDFDTIHATEKIAVDYGSGLIRMRRAGAAIIVTLGGVRHLVDALVEAGVRLANPET